MRRVPARGSLEGFRGRHPLRAGDIVMMKSGDFAGKRARIQCVRGADPCFGYWSVVEGIGHMVLAYPDDIELIPPTVGKP